MDAIETAGRDNNGSGRLIRATASRMISEVGRALIEERKSVSLGNDLRLESEKFKGAGLEFEDQVIQFSVFGSENGNGSSNGSRMRRASARRGTQRG